MKNSFDSDYKMYEKYMESDETFIKKTSADIIKEKKVYLNEINEKIKDLNKEISEVEDKYRKTIYEINTSKNAIKKQIDINEKDFSKEIREEEDILKSKYETLHYEQESKINLAYSELMIAMKESEDFFAKDAGTGLMSDKKYRFKRGQVLLEKYSSIVDSLNEAMNDLKEKRSQQIIKIGNEIEAESNKARDQSKESDETNKMFKKEIARIEKEHNNKINNLTKRYAKERGSYEAEVQKEIDEVKNTESMYFNIKQHNEEQIKAIEEEIIRLQELVPDTPTDNTSSSMMNSANPILIQLSQVESEINALRESNSQLKEEISQSDSMSRIKSTSSYH